MIAVVLAAGRGARLGGPKALLAWPVEGGELPLALAHARMRAQDCERVMVVTRADIAARLARFDVACEMVLSHAADALGPAGSLGAAAAELELDDQLVLVTPVDAPPARAATVAALGGAMRAGVLAARPAYQGRRGHPVLLRAQVLARHRTPEPPPLRDVLRELGPAVVDVEVDDPAVIADFDSAADLDGAPRFL